MKTRLENKRIWLFLVFAFGMAWALELLIYKLGGLKDISLTSTTGLLLVAVMTTPTIAHILTRLVTKEGWHDLYLRPNFKRGKRFWGIAWFLTPFLLLLGTGLYFIIFPTTFDNKLNGINTLLAQTSQTLGKPIPLTPAVFLGVQIIQAIVLGPIVNSLATLGEEFGWRAYLLKKLLPLGAQKAMLLMGVIWGIWHWPVILMGYEYGTNYPGFPWLGPVIFLWFTFIIGTYLAWLTLKSKSIWPAVIAHASLNGLAAISNLLVKGQPNPLFGPTIVGVIASLPFAALAIWLLASSDVFHQEKSVIQSSQFMSIQH
jgi:uncharacterized protein